MSEERKNAAPIARPRAGTLGYTTASAIGDEQPAIDYGAADEAFTPDPTVEALIDKNASFERIARRFWFNHRAARYLRRSIARRFSPAKANDRCIVCGQPTRGLIYAKWRFGSAGTRGGTSAGEAVTCHACCEACARPFRDAGEQARTAMAVSVLLGVAGVACLLGAVLVLREFVAAGVVVGIVLIGLGLLGGSIRQEILHSSVPDQIRDAVPTLLEFECWGLPATRP